MSSNDRHPTFEQFTRWLAKKSVARDVIMPVSQKTFEAARAARNESIAASAAAANLSSSRFVRYEVETVLLLAAASTGDDSRPPELVTAKGFRVALSYDEGISGSEASICVLVTAPTELTHAIQGQTAYLWNGAERFELGQFDSDGKAIGTLPAGIEVSTSDFASGRVKLESPVPKPKD